MIRLHSRLLRPLLVLLFAMLCAGQALAGPFTVTLDTRALAGKSGYVDFLMLGLGSAAPVQATISQFTGAYAAGSLLDGDAEGGIAGGVTLGNGAAWNEFAQWASFGGLFTFKLSFSGGDGPGDGTTLGISLLDENFGYLGVEGDVVSFALQPGLATAVSAQAGIAAVAEASVPEPATMLLVAAGLGLFASTRRRAPR